MNEKNGPIMAIIMALQQSDINHSCSQPQHEVHKQRAIIHIRSKLTYKGMLQVEQDEHTGEWITSIREDKWL